ncbi:unnamed protein product [Adineta steineri]|uniref:LRRCT domain-containing protein n=2 Tax=Adineta steineri TaxID=433720 RepID=A0A815KY29_9BILA|nr:unnamed protein product [Adineta steineri]CAF3867547.1 unnamed protein product [Adineta steineri]
MYILLILFLLPSFSSSQSNDFQTICQSGIRQDNTNYIHCGRKQLKEIPNFTRITNTFYDELVLNDNQITEISTNAFQGLRVKRLNLSGNKIRSISSQAFIELSNYLEELTIEFDSNYITQIPDAIKINLINLRSLKLIDLNLSIIKNYTFIKFRKLEYLSIIKSNIKSIESDAFISLTNLRYLNLDQNQLNDSSWYSLTKYLYNLENLILSQNKYNSLKSSNITYLKYLDLSSNGLQIIDSNIYNSLEKLYLQNNELNSLQLIFLFRLNNLKELNLDFNRLTFLPEKIFQTNSYLQDLSLQGNDLNYLTNYSFYGLKYLKHLNLARNRLQFSSNFQPFQPLKSLEILNLDRNLQMNLTKPILEDLSLSLTELSLQNCNLTQINYSFEFLIKLQRLKLSSNYLKVLPNYFLNNSVISIDLQRNFFHSIPNLFQNHSSASLIDIDLSSNQISTIDENDFRKFRSLKTIGLTGNPLNCDCHLRWIKQWLKNNYEQDLMKFLQWTCDKPKNLLGKQLTTIHEQDMICYENKYTEEDITTIFPSTNIPLTSIENINLSTSTIETLSNSLIIKDIVFNSNDILIISWEYMSLRLPKYYQIQIYNENHKYLIFHRLIDGRQKSIEIDISSHLTNYPMTYIICINLRQKKTCRNIILQTNRNSIKSASIILSPDKQNNEQFVYLLGGILLGAVLVCFILIVICYCRLRQHSKDKKKLSINSNEKIPKTFYYHPLNVISYPQQQSNTTSECSLHSSTDTTSHLTNDSYHVYQKIPSVHNCQIHSTRTHVLV